MKTIDILVSRHSYTTKTGHLHSLNTALSHAKHAVCMLPITLLRRATLMLLLISMMNAWGQNAFDGDLQEDAKMETKTLLVSKTGDPQKIGEELVSFISELDISEETNIYVRLYVSNDEGGTVDNQAVATFTGGLNWNSLGNSGWVYYKAYAKDDFNNIAVSSKGGAAAITMAVSKETNFDYTYLAGRTWRIAREEKGFLGVGDAASNGTRWWQWEPNDNSVAAMFDDRISFTVDNITSGGTYTYSPGADGKGRADKVVTILPDCPNNDTDYDYTVSQTTGKWYFEHQGSIWYLVFANNMPFPHIGTNGQYERPRYRIIQLEANRLVLVSDGDNGSSWSYIFVPDNYTEDYPATTNEWGRAETGEINYWGNVGAPESYDEATQTYTTSITGETGGNWNSGLQIRSNVQLQANEEYDFSVKLRSTVAINGVVIKVEERDNGDNSFGEQTINIPADTDYYVRWYHAKLKATTVNPVQISMGFNGSGGSGATLSIGNIVLQKPTNSHAESGYPITKDPNLSGRVVFKNYENVPQETDYTVKNFVINKFAYNDQTYGDLSVAEETGGLLVDEKNKELKYMRWYLADQDGNFLPNQERLKVTIGGEEVTAADLLQNYGHCWNWDGVTTKKLSDVKFSINLNSVSSMPKNEANHNAMADDDQLRLFKVIGILSTEPSEYNDGTPVREPKHASKVVFSFLDGSLVPDNSKITNGTIDLVKHKQVLYNPADRTLSPVLFANWREVLADVHSNYHSFPYAGYARWYLEDKDGRLVDMANFTAGVDYTERGQYGYYRLFDETDKEKFKIIGPDNTDYDPIVTLPATLPYENQIGDVRLVCVVTADRDDSWLPYREPANIVVKYIFDLYTQADYEQTVSRLESYEFVHYKGISGRDYEHLADHQAVNGKEIKQLSWSYDEGRIADGEESADIRQSVHTVVYDYYVQENVATPLSLPFTTDDTGNTEPMGYIRWYNYNTDMAADELAKTGSLSILDKTERGFIYLFPGMRDYRVGQDRIGVTVTVTDNTPDNLVIACDASRYVDGIDPTGQYLIHEPTLSVRYLFRIHKAKVIADAIEGTYKKEISGSEQSCWTVSGTTIRPNTDVLTSTANDYVVQNVFDLLENNGLVLVNLNEKDGTYQGTFTLRMSQAAWYDYKDNDTNKKTWHSFANYWMNPSSPKQGKTLRWDVYYRDDSNGWMVKSLDMTKTVFTGFTDDDHNGVVTQKRQDWRVGTYDMSDFAGSYQSLTGNQSVTLNLTDAVTKTFHMVGVIVSEDNSEAAVAHYELQFQNSPPLLWTDLQKTENKSRTEKALREKLPYGNTLTFDDYFSKDETERFKKPVASEDNYATQPLKWDNADYGFCYPQLYGENGTQYMINHHENWNGFGISPLHGDYMLLKSMYMDNVSMAWDFSNNYLALWYRDNKKADSDRNTKYGGRDEIDTPLFDITHHRDESKYGTFLYVDAADESRTIATLDFEAKGLCATSELYYTAYVANMTTDATDEKVNKEGNKTDYYQTPPQLLFHVYVIDENETDPEKQKKQVVSFLTSDLTSLGADAGHWYQLYGHVRIPADKLPEKRFDAKGNLLPDKFIVEIDNYATSTFGADYAIDEISFYTCAAELHVEQKGKGQCDSDGLMEARFYLDAENLHNVLGTFTERTIYYRIYDEKGQVVKGSEVYTETTVKTDDSKEVYQTTYKDKDATYGQVLIKNSYANTNLLETYEAPEESTSDTVKEEYNKKVRAGYYTGEDGKVYFRVVWGTKYPFEVNKKYYMSIYDISESTFDESADKWGGPNRPCSTYSDNFIARKVHITLMDGDTAIEEKEADCDGWWKVDLTAVASMPSTYNDDYASDNNGYTAINNLHYDYYIGTYTEFQSTDNLVQALDSYRDQVGFAETVGLDASFRDVNETYYEVLKTAVAEGKLLLSWSSKFEYEFVAGGTYHFVAIPYERYVDLTDMDNIQVYRKQKATEDAAICQPIPFDVNYITSQPLLELGFEDVSYPSTSTYRTLRMGLEQMCNLQANNYTLHVPVNTFKVDAGGTAKTGTLIMQSFLLFGTDDPTVTDKLAGDNYLLANDVELATFANTKNIGGKEKGYVDSDNMFIALNFKAAATTGITFHEGYEYKILLQYHTEADETAKADGERCESALPLLLKIVPEFVTWDGSTGNVNWNNDENWTRSRRAELHKAAKGQDGNSATNGHPSGYEDNSEINTDLGQPRTYVPMKFSYVTLAGDAVAPHLLQLQKGTTSGTDQDIYTNISDGIDAATPNIQYDMLVRYTEQTCQGHLKADNTKTTIEGNIYDCEKFYGNQCNEIYFKPEAELLYQQHLTYNKAWVEKTLKRGQWYLLSSPLKNVYAGDMYVPKATGQQTSEAFQHITFDKDINSRTTYPVYQRSWDTTGSTVVTADASSYTADLTFESFAGDDVSQTLLQWSHVYNDVSVDYAAAQGFSLRMHRTAGTDDALLRLPKADTQYSYYDYNNNVSGTTTSTLTRTDNYRFVTDGYDDATVSKTVTAVQSTGNQYYLVGNPYMCSVDMEKFFAANTGLGSKYWTYKDGAPSAELTTGLVAPMQSFFVKSDTKPTITFNKSMMVDGNTTQPLAPAPRRMMTLQATDGNATTTARVVVDSLAHEGYAESEDVETLFDSQLSDVPTVYTVAGQQAVSIDQRTGLTALPFGVVSGTDGAVSVVLTGLADVTDETVYLLDAADGSTTAVGDGEELSVEANEYGRYFLVTTSALRMPAAAVQQDIRLSVHQREVTVTASAPLGHVRALTLSGQTVYSQADCTEECRFPLSQGVYVVEADGAAGHRTFKIMVK